MDIEIEKAWTRVARITKLQNDYWTGNSQMCWHGPVWKTCHREDTIDTYQTGSDMATVTGDPSTASSRTRAQKHQIT